MDLAADPDRHWYEHRCERNAERTSTGSTPGTSHRRPGAGGRILCGAAAVAAGAGPRPLWLPYAEVERIGDATEHARRLGATVLLEPREGPSGWRSVVSSPVAGEVALWEPK